MWGGFASDLSKKKGVQYIYEKKSKKTSRRGGGECGDLPHLTLAARVSYTKTGIRGFKAFQANAGATA